MRRFSLDGEVGEDVAHLGHVAEAGGGAAVGRQPLTVPILAKQIEPSLIRVRPDHVLSTVDFPEPFGTEDGQDLVGLTRAKAVQDRDGSIASRYPVELEKRDRHAGSPR